MSHLSKLIFALLLLSGLTATAQVPSASSDSIRRALDYQIATYPASQYRDIYKLFMQDFYGPGHILGDIDHAHRYLKYELENFEILDGPDYEPTGFRGNFYRVNIRLIADGTVPYDVFFNAFAESVSAIVPPSHDDWMSIWRQIDREITGAGYHFVNENEDRQELGRQFEKGNYIVHHSRGYNEAANFHYRIISRENFNRFIYPYLSSN